MIDWAETFRFYKRHIIFSKKHRKDLCDWYQNQNRFYLDEV